ncbi:unnamed protein product [Amoebophrya sp. A25]|nr:unnamed protein product [Amoebophrya sp. A25]|eukprot:GSA25T00013157001.1
MGGHGSVATEVWVPLVAIGTGIAAVALAYVLFTSLNGSSNESSSSSKKSLPGTLQAKGAFSLPAADLSDQSTLDERRRDFYRIIRAQKDLRFAILEGGKLASATDSLKLIEVPADIISGDGREPSSEQMEKILKSLSRFFDDAGAEQLSKKGIFSLVSATTPFAFAMKFGVPPMFHEPHYALLYHKDRKTFQVLWAAAINDKAEPVPADKRWPFFTVYLSDEIDTAIGGSKEIPFTYWAMPNTDETVAKSVEDFCREQFS